MKTENAANTLEKNKAQQHNPMRILMCFECSPMWVMMPQQTGRMS